jgi:hypothetical protein
VGTTVIGGRRRRDLAKAPQHKAASLRRSPHRLDSALPLGREVISFGAPSHGIGTRNRVPRGTNGLKFDRQIMPDCRTPSAQIRPQLPKALLLDDILLPHAPDQLKMTATIPLWSYECCDLMGCSVKPDVAGQLGRKVNRIKDRKNPWHASEPIATGWLRKRATFGLFIAVSHLSALGHPHEPRQTEGGVGGYCTRRYNGAVSPTAWRTLSSTLKPE